MRNAPYLKLDSAADDGAEGSRVAIGDVPVMRIAVLMLLLTLPVAAVGARLVWLQGRLTEAYAAAWETTTVSEEPIPCRDGRILSADGQILAHDRLRYDVLVHFRWLEEPADERWLTQQALSRLSRRDRRRTARVDEAEQRVLEDRRHLWELLAATLDRPQSELTQTRKQIQRRVENIVESVTRRRDERLAESARNTRLDEPLLISQGFSPLKAQWWKRVQQAVVGQLTTSPRRARLDPVIVREELDHHVVAIDVGIEAVTAIETASSRFPGVLVRMKSERVYPQADVASHIIGVRTELQPDEVTPSGRSTGQSADSDRSPVLLAGDRIGRDGIERSFDATLRGRRGTRRIVRNRGGEVISQEVIQQPGPGRDVVLTIDLALQRKAERLLDEAIAPPPSPPGSGTGSEAVAASASSPVASVATAQGATTAQGGCLVVLDVRTGEVVAAAAAPRYDLQLLTRPDPDEWRAALSDPRRPFFPRVTQMTVPPGSVFKILTAVALLESRKIDPDEPFFCQGYLDHPHRNRCYIYRHYGVGHGDMTLSDAICQSCNVYFFNAARTLGPAVIADWASRFGLGVPTGSEVPGEKAGHLPHADRSGKISGEQWYGGSTLQLAIGQASLTVTPLQVARMIAAVANGGYLVTPQFVDRRRSAPNAAPNSPPDRASETGIRLVGYENEMSPPPAERIPGLSPQTLERIREGMQRVVQTRKGTGRRAAVTGITMAGKTGTAEVGGGKKDHAWFVGFVPAEAPRYAFAVVLEHGGSGGRAAAPLAKQFIESMADAGLLRRSMPPEPASE